MSGYNKEKDSGRRSIDPFSEEGQSSEQETQVSQDAAQAPSTALEQAAATFPSENEIPAVGPVADPPTGLSNQSIDQFKFLECDPLIPGEAPEPCPVCRENEFAYVPDYSLLDNGDVFFDGKRCMQSVVITVNTPAPNFHSPGPTVDTLESLSFQEEYKRRGIRLILDYFNKSEEATVYYYQRDNNSAGLGGEIVAAVATSQQEPPREVKGYTIVEEQRDVVEEIMPYTEYEFSIPLQRNARTRILISIPVEYLDRVPNRIVTEPMAAFEADMEVTIPGSEFWPMTRRLKRALQSYNSKYNRWNTLDGGQLVERTTASADPYGAPAENGNKVYLKLDNEASDVITFAKAINDMLEEGAGFTLKDPATYSGFFSNMDAENITLKFEEVGESQLILKRVIANKPGCPDVIFSENSDIPSARNAFVKFVSEGTTSSRTLYYIGALPEINDDLMARDQKPWLEFVIDYTYPPMEVFYGTNPNTLMNDPNSMQCLADAAMQSGAGMDFATDILDTALDIGLSIPDAIVASFQNNTCKNEEELKEELNKLSPTGSGTEEYIEQYKIQLERIKQIQNEFIQIEDPYLDVIIEEVSTAISNNKKVRQQAMASRDPNIRKRDFKKTHQYWRLTGDKITVERLWQSIFTKIGICGFLDMTMTAADCVAKGLGQESASRAMAEAAFNAMSDAQFERMFIGLPPEQQEEIFNKVTDELGDILPPWDVGYVAGSYEGPGRSMGNFYEDKSRKDVQRELERYFDLPSGAYSSSEDWMLNSGLDQMFSEDPNHPWLMEQEQNISDPKRNTQSSPDVLRIAGVEIPGSELEFGAPSPGSDGTYGSALGAIQKTLFDSYRKALLDTLEVDTLIAELNKLPGAPIAADLIKQLSYTPCKVQVPSLTFEPRLDSFMNTLEADICKWDGNLSLPRLDKGQYQVGVLNLYRISGIAGYEAIKEAALALSMELLKKVLDKLFTINCDAIATLGANLLDLVSGNDHFRDLLRDNLCPNATDDQLYDALSDLLMASQSPGPSCLESLTNQEMSDFIDDVSLMLTQGQVIQLLTGTANQETMTLATEIAATSNSECIRETFSNPNAFNTFFPALGTFIPDLEELADALAPDALSRPVLPCPDDLADIINDLRCDLLQEKGLDQQQCRDQIDELKEQALQDLKDLADLMQEGPFSNFPPLEGGPGCPATGLYPAVDPAVDDLNASISQSIFQRIETSHLRDLMGRKGVLNYILADTNGRAWNFHSWLVGAFGSPLSQDLGVFEFYSDNSINEPGSKRSGPKVDIYGNTIKDFGASIGGQSAGGVPPTVGAWMAKTLRELDPVIKTITVPEGSVGKTASELQDEWWQVYEENQRRIELRLSYLEAYFEEFKFDEGGPLAVKWPQKYALAKGDITRAAREPLFNTDRSEIGDFAEYSGEERAFNALSGKNISVGGQLVGSKSPEKWEAESGTDGKTFIERYGPDDFKLGDYPDTSSADIRLQFADYGDDPGEEGSLYSFDLNYDYNLFESDGNLKKDNEYSVRLDVTYNSPNGGGASARKAARKNGIELPASVLDEGPYTYTKFQLITKGDIEADVEEYLNELGVYDGNVGDSYQIEAMYRYFVKALASASDNSATVVEISENEEAFREYFTSAGSMAYDSVSGGFLKRVSQSISTGRADKPLDGDETADAEPGFLDPPSPDEQNKKEAKRAEELSLETLSPGFLFGYDPYREPTIEYLDPEEYGGWFAQQLIQIGTDPELVPKPFYVHEQEYGGWFDVARALVPEIDGCEPARAPAFNLEDIADSSATLCGQLVQDPRLGNDPLCAQESPYDKILEVGPSSNIDGAIRAIIRIYINDVFIKATPAFIMFAMTNENYNDLLPAYIAEKMKSGLRADGRLRNGKSSNTYYHRFLEQCYNTVRRKINSELLDPLTELTEKEKDARLVIEQEIQHFYDTLGGQEEALSAAAISGQNYMKRAMSKSAKDSPIGLGYGSASFDKRRAMVAKDSAFREVMSRTENEATVFLERYIREEFESMKEIYRKNIPSVVENVDHLFLISDAWVHGGVFGSGPFDVQSDPKEGTDYNITIGMPSWAEQTISLADALGDEAGSVLADALRRSYEASSKNWPFVLEKYIKVEGKTFPAPEISGRPDNLYDIVNLKDWDEYIKAKASEGLTGKISDWWGPEEDTEKTGWSFGLRLSYKVEDASKGSFQSAFDTISENTALSQKSYKLMSPEGEKYIIPIASAELPIPDQEFTLFDPDSYDVYCLIQELIKTVEYRTWFRYMFPLTRYTSLMAIYISEGFFASLGNSGWPSSGGDMWPVAGGRKSASATFRRWNRSDDKLYENSRHDARDIFTTLYDTAASIDFESENKYNSDSYNDTLRESIRAKVNFEDGLRWWQRGRRVTNRPFDKDGNECPDE